MHHAKPQLLAYLLILLAVIVPLVLPFHAAARPMLQDDLPPEGWTVCVAGGMQFIPEVGENRQVFEVCHGEGWRYQAYCTQPSVPIPSIGVFCSLLPGGVLWCGDAVQQLQLYAILQTPEATATPTNTATATVTLTSTATNTLTPTATVTPTGTPVQATRTLTETATEEAAATTTPPVVRTFLPGDDRPRPGGPGNVEAAGVVLGAVLGPLAGFVLLRRRNADRS